MQSNMNGDTTPNNGFTVPDFFTSNNSFMLNLNEDIPNETNPQRIPNQPQNQMPQNRQQFQSGENQLGYNNEQDMYTPLQRGRQMNEYNSSINPYYSQIGMQVYPYYLENSNDIDQDLNYLRLLYPRELRPIINEINRILDQLEYEGSSIYDEFPDRVYLSNFIDRIYQTLNSNGTLDSLLIAQNNCSSCARVIIEILFYHEAYERRRRYRSNRRAF